MIERPTVTANDQGPDAQKQAGVIAHNDIPAATNDRTDAPRLEMTPEARAATAPSAMEGHLQPDSGPLDGSAQNEAAISAANMGEVPAAVDAAAAAIDQDNAAELALIAADEAEARESLDPKFDVQPPAQPAKGGVWQCQNVKCHNLFEDGTQTVVQAGGVPLRCPHCHSDHVLYVGESRESAQEVV